MSDPQTRIGFCPHCGNKSQQEIALARSASDVGWAAPTGEEVDLPCSYEVGFCGACGQLLLYKTEFYGPQQGERELIWPATGRLDKSVPIDIRRVYEEAFRIKELAPNAFSVQIRRAVEAVCRDRGAKGRSLAQMLGDLAMRGEIPQTLSEAADALRVAGNVAAHASDADVKPWQVNSIDEFFRAVVEYVYVAPSRIKRFRDSFKSQPGSSEVESDGVSKSTNRGKETV